MKRINTAIVAIILMSATLFVAGCKRDESDDVRVTTYTPRDITGTTATCGGDVIVTQGLSLSELGVCWSTERKPTAEDAHLYTTNWEDPYICTLTDLSPNTKYHVRAYALRGLEYYYGDDKVFTTEDTGGGSGNTSYNGHEYVDLGLPSGTLWATCNGGADVPEGYGNYYAWGETQTKASYDWTTYLYCTGDFNKLTKYCCSPMFGTNVDNLSVLVAEDDAATANWGEGWRMPTKEEWDELLENTTNTWTKQNDVYGRLFTSSKGASLFIPAGGRYWAGDIYSAGGYGYYASSSLNKDISSNVFVFYFYNGQYYMKDEYRCYGWSVRPVHVPN